MLDRGECRDQALKDRVKDLKASSPIEAAIEIRNQELAALQKKLGTPATLPPRLRPRNRQTARERGGAHTSAGSSTGAPGGDAAAEAAQPRRCRRPNPIRPLRRRPRRSRQEAGARGRFGLVVDWVQDNLWWWAPCSPR